MAKPLRLMARDAEDVAILSTTLQDAILRVGDMTYLPKKNRFAAVLNRFCWEEAAAKDAKTTLFGRPLYQRVRTGMHFDGVLGVRSQHIALEKKDALLSLLTVEFEAHADGAGIIKFIFAGGGTVHLDVECIDASLKDITDPWVTKNVPDHDIPESDTGAGDGEK